MMAMLHITAASCFPIPIASLGLSWEDDHNGADTTQGLNQLCRVRLHDRRRDAAEFEGDGDADSGSSLRHVYGLWNLYPQYASAVRRPS